MSWCGKGYIDGRSDEAGALRSIDINIECSHFSVNRKSTNPAFLSGARAQLPAALVWYFIFGIV